MTALDFQRLIEEEMKALRGNHIQQSDTLNMESNSKVQVDDAELSPPVMSNGLIEFDSITLSPIGSIDKLMYCRSAVNEEVEQTLLDCVNWSTSVQPWRQLRGRKLQCWGNFPVFDGNTKIEDLSSPMPSWISVLIDGLVAAGVFGEDMRPDNVLINQYQPNEGILHHTDGPAYYNRVAILSLGSDTILSFRKKLTTESIGREFAGDVCSVFLEQRSLFVFEKEAYTQYMHGIADEEPVQIIHSHGHCVNAPPTDTQISVTRGIRTSITFRKLKSIA